MIKIKIIRHSERLDFTNPLYWLCCIGQYWADTPLTTNGYNMANEKGKSLVEENFNPIRIYSSPYNRTLSTSTEIKNSFPHSEMIVEPLLAEYQPSYKHRVNLYPNGIPTTYDGEETNFVYPETHENFTKRIQFIISKLFEKNNNDIIIVTHSEILKVLINYFQTFYPNVVLYSGSTPYLTTLSFDYDKVNDTIIENSIKLE